MHHGGYYSERTARVTKLCGLMLPVVLVGYGILIQLGYVQSDYFTGYYGFAALIIIWLILAALQYFGDRSPDTRERNAAIRLAGYHILGVGYILLVSGFSAPPLICYVLLLVVAYIHFGLRALQLSLLVLLGTLLYDLAFGGKSHDSDVANTVAVIASLGLGVAISFIIRSLQVDTITLKRSQSQEALERERILTIVNNLADAVLSTDERGIVRVYNASSLNLLDTNDSLNGHHIDEILPLQTTDGEKFKLSTALKKAKGVEIRDDLRYSYGDDESIRLEVTFSPIRSSFSRSKKGQAQDGYIIIMRDVTKPKSLEEERDEFISVVSHELRTPIAVAEGTISNTQLMVDRTDIPKATLKQSIDMAHEQIVFLAKMVNDLSTLSRAERGVSDTPETVNVRQLVDELYAEYAPQAEAKGLHFNLDLSAKLGNVNVSPLYLKELLQNFVTNSIKYTKTGDITLVVAQNDKTVSFAVRDTGIGISKADQAKIFNKFYRSEDYRTRETGGTGLGLYVATKLAKKLGCEIKLVSRLNHGSTFSFELPVQPESLGSN